MSTINQIASEKIRKKRKKKNLYKSLDNCPQKRGTCIKVFTTNPKKPNSGNRKVTRVNLSNNKNVTCFIPGIGHNLQKHSVVLVAGGGARDLPFIRYRLIRGKYDLKGIEDRVTSRSKYGARRKQ